MSRATHELRRRLKERLELDPRFPNRKREQGIVEAWNAAHPVGVAVRVRMDDDSTKDTKTIAPAELLGGHTAVAWLEGFESCYRLSRCRALRADELRP